MCELCDFVSNRESGYKIHMSRKHATIEQLDGNIEDVNDSKYSDEMWSKELEENDEFIENYLMTGELDCCDAIETLQFVLSPYSLQSKSLSSKQVKKASKKVIFITWGGGSARVNYHFLFFLFLMS